MENYLKEINPKAQSLVKVKQSQPNIENYLDIISKECFLKRVLREFKVK